MTPMLFSLRIVGSYPLPFQGTYRWSLIAASCALTVGCATSPTPAPEAAVAQHSVAELNLPQPDGEPECDCPADVAGSVENYFDRGVRALAARDYARARVYFERHRDSGLAQAQREANVGIAFVTLLDQSIVEGAGERGASGVDERAEVMILAMAAIDVLEEQLRSLEKLNKTLVGDLAKREEALKRLRDLTLGQPEG